MEVKAPLLSIVIVNYKNQQLILDCVNSIKTYETRLDCEIVIVDNESNDNTEQLLREIYPELVWIQMGYNSGFSRANNAGIKKATGEFILLLNSDTILINNNVLENCILDLKSLPNYRQIILGTKLLNEDGSYQETLRLKFPSLGDYWKINAISIFFKRIFTLKSSDKAKQELAHNNSGYVSWINAAFLLFERSNVMAKKLLFDEDFFLYSEDVELAWRARKSGFQFYYSAKYQITHIGSASMPIGNKKRAQLVVSEWLYLRKTRSRAYLFFTLCIVRVNLLLDDFLHFFAKLRGKKPSENVISEQKFRVIHKYLLKQYGKLLISNKSLSLEDSFKTNCYEDSFIAEKSK